MGEIVLRVRLVSGDRLDVTYDEPSIPEPSQLVDHIVSTLAKDTGVLRTEHGDRLLVLYGRGVAALEIAPRGAIL